MAKTCTDLKEMFELAYSKKQPKLFHQFYLNEGLLLKCTRFTINKMEMERIQIVVLKCLRKTVLIAAYESNWSAHLGRNKTFNRLIKHFYWNKIRTDVSYFRNTCHVCQLLGKAKTIPPKAPLIKIAIEDEPFHRIVVDLCGPLPACNETNNRLIFTAVDTCTRYPIAIPLARHTAVMQPSISLVHLVTVQSV